MKFSTRQRLAKLEAQTRPGDDLATRIVTERGQPRRPTREAERAALSRSALGRTILAARHRAGWDATDLV